MCEKIHGDWLSNPESADHDNPPTAKYFNNGTKDFGSSFPSRHYSLVQTLIKFDHGRYLIS